MVINFDKVESRVKNMRGRLEGILLDGNEDGVSVSADDVEWNARGPRLQSAYWIDMMKKVQKNGSRAAVSVTGQFASFENTQPG